MPPHLFKDQNTAAAFILTFLHSIIIYQLVYYVPVYFQAVQGSTPSRSGMQLMPAIIIWISFAQIGGRPVTRFGRYRPRHHVGFALETIGMGCKTLLNRNSSTGEMGWVSSSSRWQPGPCEFHTSCCSRSSRRARCRYCHWYQGVCQELRDYLGYDASSCSFQ